MSSLVLELQRDAMDHTVPVSTLLRKCLVIATKLNLEEFRKWVEDELNGYYGNQAIPPYRFINGELRTFNPSNGIWMQIIWQGQEPEWAHRMPVAQQIAELENIVKDAGKEEGALGLSLPSTLKQKMTRSSSSGFEPSFLISPSGVHAIVDAVRNVVLKWSLKLEKDGILGENMSFTPEEKKKASAGGNTYNISNSTGVFLGDVKADALQVGDFNSIYADLKRLGIPQKERNELENIVDELKTAEKEPEKKQKLLTQGVNWLVRNAYKLGALSETIRKWFEPGP